jgi:hypothetical protein
MDFCIHRVPPHHEKLVLLGDNLYSWFSYSKVKWMYSLITYEIKYNHLNIGFFFFFLQRRSEESKL